MTATTKGITNAGFTYYAAGNVTTDASFSPVHTYEWDGEGRMKTVDNGSTATNTYNALGQQVEKIVPGYQADEVYDLAGRNLGQYSPTTGAWAFALLWFGSRVIAKWSPSQTNFVHVNHLGSTAMVTDYFGHNPPLQDQLFYPWGQQWTHAGTQQDLHFATLPPHQGLWYAHFRRHDPRLGRWLSTDPVRGDVQNPQTLNLYPYVADNATNRIDPQGNQFCGSSCGCSGCDPFGGSGFGVDTGSVIGSGCGSSFDSGGGPFGGCGCGLPLGSPKGGGEVGFASTGNSFDCSCGPQPVVISVGGGGGSGGAGKGKGKQPKPVPCRGTESCDYYDRRCKDPRVVQKWYYCTAALAVCNRRVLRGPKTNCIRLCLQQNDTCWSMTSRSEFVDCISGLHEDCISSCAGCTVTAP